MSFLSFARCRKAFLLRYFYQQAACDGRPPLLSPQVDQGTFEAVGLHPAVTTSLRVAFPSVRAPTTMQRKLLRAISQGRDILLQDDTGTGKSFAAMLALLSKLREPKESQKAVLGEKSLTGLLIVPHRDLACQYLHWIHHMTLPDGNTPLSLAKYAQVLVRYGNKAILRGLPVRAQEAIKSASFDQDSLIDNPPHILITTPNALLDLIRRKPEVIRVLTPSTVVVDEVDALLHIPNGQMRKEKRSPREKLGKHVPDLVQILDRLYPTSRSKQRMRWGVCSDKRATRGQSDAALAYRPQLVMMSATLRNRLRSALFSIFGWLEGGEVLKLIRRRSSALPAHRLGRSAVHHVLVVSETGDIKNIGGAGSLEDATNDTTKDTAELVDEEGVSFYDDDEPEPVGDIDRALLRAPLAFDPAMLEAVAGTFAVDVPRIALLVLPATAAVRKIILELQQLGVNAHPLDLVSNEASRAHIMSRVNEVSEENPALIVATLATIRGIDLPDLTHVFMLGVPEGRSGDAYLHIAGRVGRFGRRGKVVTILEERREERVGKRVVARDDPKRMTILFSRIGVRPTRLEHYA